MRAKASLSMCIVTFEQSLLCLPYHFCVAAQVAAQAMVESKKSTC